MQALADLHAVVVLVVGGAQAGKRDAVARRDHAQGLAAPDHMFMGKLHRRRWFLLFVALPTILATIYYGLIASDVYVSQSRFVIKAPGQKSMPTTTPAATTDPAAAVIVAGGRSPSAR